jgi:uncharacterized SAM-binding protein YcdF (DUF218 family)
MFETLTFILIWLFIGWLIWYLLFQVKAIPVPYYTGLGIVTICALLTIAFMNPDGRTSESIGSLLSLLITPLGLSLLLLSRWVLRDGPGKFATNGITAWAFTVLLLFSTPAISFLLAGQLEREAVQMVGNGDRNAVEAIVLLGNGTTRVAGIGQQRIELTESGDRITLAAQLYRSGRANRIIVSAGFRPELNAYWRPASSDCRNPDGTANTRCRAAESSDISILLQEMGVPASAIVIPRSEVANKREVVNVRNSALDIRDEFGGNPQGARVALVTSAIEMRRSTLAFEAVGFRVVPQPSDFYTLPYDAPDITPLPWRYFSIPDLVPSSEGLTISTKVVTEYLQSVFYFLRGWISPFRL